MPINLHLWLIPTLCFLGFALNILFGRLWSKAAAGTVGILFPAAAFLWGLRAALAWSSLPVHPYLESHGAWILAGPLRIPFGFQLDPLSLVMLLVVSGVGLVIHVYSLGYMSEEGGFYRYFALLNMFLFFMLTLVLANNYLLMFVGWEGVGFASYMLIGFFFRRDSASRAGMKAFVVNRIGDFGFLIGLFYIFQLFGGFEYTRVFPQVMRMPAETGWHGPLTLIALLLFAGATGKSAQLPLYVWLPDAMEGPTPVSALIHAATMVTAGVYMVARSAAIFDRSAVALEVVLAVGALTAIFAASIGMLQRDIKRVLAYSTVSQLGYMFMACGAAAYGAGIFHLMTHAFFKGLLFLAAGSVIHAMHGEQDMFRIRTLATGGLKRYAPITFWTFLIATCAITGIPGFSGYFSKDLILEKVFTGAAGSRFWWAVGAVAAAMTAFYMFRAVFVTFFPARGGEAEHAPAPGLAGHAHPSGQEPATVVAHPAHPHESPKVMTIPLIILAVLAAVGGFLNLGDRFMRFLAPVFQPAAAGTVALGPETPAAGWLKIVPIVAAIGGLCFAWWFYQWKPELARRSAQALPRLYALVFNKYWVDELYQRAIIAPLTWISRRLLWRDVDQTLIDGSVNGVGRLAQAAGDRIRRQQSGYIRSYASWVGAGAVVVLLYVLWLGAR